MGKTPTQADINVGGRLRVFRIRADMTQTDLGHALGLTFQQIQKYEKGTNRIGAGRLETIAKIFKVPISAFFDDERNAGRVDLRLNTRLRQEIFEQLKIIDDIRVEAIVRDMLAKIIGSEKRQKKPAPH
jgi:transcriptional regulator with XRE-family HTH domain